MSEKEEKKENELDEFGKQDEGEYGCGPIGGSAFGCLNNVGFFTVMLSIAVMLQAGTSTVLYLYYTVCPIWNWIDRAPNRGGRESHIYVF